MTRLNPAMRLKVKGDTFFLPDPNGGVYFRNNAGSFRMEGKEIDQWMEILMPMFNGEHTLAELTDGLPDLHRDRVFEIAEVLYRNGFVRDLSQDRPHQLPDEVLNKYASQIEYLDSLGGSGAYRFQAYRRVNALAAGSGPFLVSLVAALLESGLPQIRVWITDSLPTNRQRLAELAEHARKTDPEVSVEEIALPKELSAWREAVQPFHSILYVSQEGDLELLRNLQAVCREEKKMFLPAVCLQQAGLAGPLVHPDADGCWESAWRRIHASALRKDPQLHAFSPTAGAMLANVLVFEWFKAVTGVTESEGKNAVYLLDLETLEGNWHSFLPHPLVTGPAAAEWVCDLDRTLHQGSASRESSGLLPCFGTLTSAASGIFHVWEEGDLKQLPLAQCRVQAADPLSEGPAELLPELVGTGLTHEEARREAGLAGIEAYVSRMAGLLVSTLPPRREAGGIPTAREYVGVGAGETVGEGVCRGLEKCLAEELGRRMGQHSSVFPAALGAVEDERCRFYLQALTTMCGAPQIGLGADVSGFPVVWVSSGGRWYGSAGLNVTLALRNALKHALERAQNPLGRFATQALEVSAVVLEAKVPLSLAIPACEQAAQTEVLRSALQVLKQNGKRLLVCDLSVEPFMKEELSGVFGVWLREEGSR